MLLPQLKDLLIQSTTGRRSNEKCQSGEKSALLARQTVTWYTAVHSTEVASTANNGRLNTDCLERTTITADNPDGFWKAPSLYMSSVQILLSDRNGKAAAA